jgi:hypothetical protein
MNLGQLRTEVLNRGFDPGVYGARIDQFINDAQNLIARRVDYYINEDSQTYSTVAGTNLYPLPTNFARVRELFATDVTQIIAPVGIRDIDGSSSTTQGRPYAYALDGANLHLYPTPDNIYPLELRYWTMPPALINDTDIPTIPVDWHQLLWLYGTWICYEADDDAQMGQYWQGRFNNMLAQFTADQKFPSTDYPNRIESMWGDGRVLYPPGAWSLYGG